MKAFVTWLFSLALVSQSAVACLNDHAATRLDGSWQSSDDDRYTRPAAPTGRDLVAEAPANRRRLHVLDSLWHARHSLADYAGYGLVLTYLGRYAEASAVFRQLEDWQPNQYATASNLGTVYELLGQNRLALYWIEKAIRLNPHSHRGTEWLHANILRAKIEGAPAVNSSFLLGVDFGSEAVPVPVLRAGFGLDSVQQALYYQLSERLSFVYPTDPLMAELLFDLGNTYALTSNVEAALPVYAQAQQFGYHGGLLLKRRVYFWWLSSGEGTVMTGLFFAIVGLLGFGLWRLGHAAVRRFA